MKKKTQMGYVVLGRPGGSYRLVDEPEPDAIGVLWWATGSQPATIFSTREKASKAIATTIAYADAKNYMWAKWVKKAYIQSVIRAPHAF